MARRKRRRPAGTRATPASRAEVVAVQPEPTTKSRAFLGKWTSARPGRARPGGNTDPDNEPTWNKVGLLVLLGLVFVLQIGIGAVSHAIGHRQRLLVVDLFFFQAPFVLPACVILMPLAKYLTHQPRTLRFLESLSLGAIFALLSLLLITVFVHPAIPGSVSTDQYIDRLGAGDAVGIAFADILAVLGSVQLYPGLQRRLGAPGRRARARMIARNEAAKASMGGARGAAPGASRASREAKATKPGTPRERR